MYRAKSALLEAVKNCWASLWTARAISYRMHQGIDPATLSLAVVVQQLVPADAAGILFTANPVDGERDQIVINATWGLGEAIVGGQVTPDTVIVDKSDQQILSRKTATKTIMTVRTDYGTEDRPYRKHSRINRCSTMPRPSNWHATGHRLRRTMVCLWTSSGRWPGVRVNRHLAGAAHHQFAARPVERRALGAAQAGHHLDATTGR